MQLQRPKCRPRGQFHNALAFQVHHARSHRLKLLTWVAAEPHAQARTDLQPIYFQTIGSVQLLSNHFMKESSRHNESRLNYIVNRLPLDTHTCTHIDTAPAMHSALDTHVCMCAPNAAPRTPNFLCIDTSACTNALVQNTCPSRIHYTLRPKCSQPPWSNKPFLILRLHLCVQNSMSIIVTHTSVASRYLVFLQQTHTSTVCALN